MSSSKRYVYHLISYCNVLSLSIALSCNHPTEVKYLPDASGNPYDVEHWQILFQPDPAQNNHTPKTTLDQLKREKQYKSFVDEVQSELVRKHGFSFAVNVPVRGTIEIMVGDATDREFWFDRSTQGDDLTDIGLKKEVFTATLDTAYISRDSVSISLVDTRIQITWAEVTIHDDKGLPCGQITIERDRSSKISPDEVAKAIDQFINTRQD